VKTLQLITNGIGAENDKPSENPELTQDSENRQFEDDEQDNS
jgi:hypothetical protein